MAMTRAEFSDYIVNQCGKITRYVVGEFRKTRAHAAGKSEVYRIDEDGIEHVRNLYISMYGGYFVEPSLRERWCKIEGGCPGMKSGSSMHSGRLTDAEKKAIVEAHPEFRWTLQKAGNISKAEAMRILTAWKRNPKTELLVGAKLDNLVGNGSFERMKLETQKKVLAFIRATPGAQSWNLGKILFVMNGRSAKEYEAWQEFCFLDGKCAFDVYKYLQNAKCRPNSKARYYQDYIETAKRCGHDVKDKYWKFPKDLVAAHNKVVAEYNNILEARRLEEQLLNDKREREKKKNFLAMARNFANSIVRKSGLVVSVPADIKNVSAQAKALHQCLVSADYIGRMADKELVLVFVRTRAGEPVATAEIKPDGSIGQFYADEDQEDIRPSEKAHIALDAWLKEYRATAIKSMKKKPQREAA